MKEILKEYPFRCVLSFKPFIDYLRSCAADPYTESVCKTEDIQGIIDQAPELLEPIEDLTILEKKRDTFHKLMSLVFPPVFWDSEAAAAAVPFTIKPIFASPSFRRLFINDKGIFQGTRNIDDDTFNRGRAIRAYLFILKKFYGIHNDFEYPLIHIVSDPATGLNRHFRIRIDFRFVEAHAATKPRSLSDQDRNFISQHLAEPDLIKDILRPEDFEIHGFTIFQAMDVTESEMVSALERDLIDQESIVSEGGFRRLEDRLRILFRRPDLVAGVDAIKEDQVLQLTAGDEKRHCCIFADSHHLPISEFEGSVFYKAVEKDEILRVDDVLEEASEKFKKEDVLKMGVRSLMVAPLHYQDECIGVLHIGSPEPGALGINDVMLMDHLQPIFSMAVKRALDDLENRIQGVIKEKCTAIHPAVEWRFQKAAFHYLDHLRQGEATEIEPIVFKDVYPLYGVADIRGSTVERNRAIQKDLKRHLELALKVVLSANESGSMLIFKELAGRINTQIDRINEGLGSGDELSVVNFLQKEVEPVFPQLKGAGIKVNRAIDNYDNSVDPNMGTVYNLRWEFEESVSVLNDRLTAYLDQEEAEAQLVFPHYFERHRTDGVDYVAYMGGALLEDGKFSEIYLKNMRLWQMKVACGMAWHTEQLKSTLKIPLDVAQLILVQDTPLSIRFRFDEKRFDVDGAYDIRQEIIKSRLDKAMVKGSKERLTQPGKIAIVYSQPGEEDEILRHIDFLVSEGYLNEDLESLELDALPGVQGLKSFRVGVKLDSQVLSERASLVAG